MTQPLYHRVLPGGLVVTSTAPEHAPGLEQLQVVVFPTLADHQRFKVAHYLRHIEVFPEGQMCVLDGDLVVGMTTTIRYAYDFEHPEHTFEELIGGGWLVGHDPEGDWLYGLDVGSHPAYRGRGIARALYEARHEVAARLGLKGQVTVGMLSGLGERKHEISADDYYAGVASGQIVDPTVTMQMHMGFEPRGLLRGYLEDPVCDTCGATLVLPIEKGLAPKPQRPSPGPSAS